MNTELPLDFFDPVGFYKILMLVFYYNKKEKAK